MAAGLSKSSRIVLLGQRAIVAQTALLDALPFDMQCTCNHASHMPKMIQIRHVPDLVHRKIKARAAEAGQTLSDYLLAEIERIAALPTRDEMLARLHAHSRVKLKVPAARVIRKERDADDRR